MFFLGWVGVEIALVHKELVACHGLGLKRPLPLNLLIQSRYEYCSLLSSHESKRKCLFHFVIRYVWQEKKHASYLQTPEVCHVYMATFRFWFYKKYKCMAMAGHERGSLLSSELEYDSKLVLVTLTPKCIVISQPPKHKRVGDECHDSKELCKCKSGKL